MVSRRFTLMLLAAMLLTATARFSAAAVYPPGVPNFNDPGVQTEFVRVAVSRFEEDPDFPVLVLARLTEEPPQFLLVILDARNGKETWSLREDQAVFYMLLSDPGTILQAYLDDGFALGGKPSGRFTAAGPETVGELIAKLRESHRQSRRSRASAFTPIRLRFWVGRLGLALESSVQSCTVRPMLISPQRTPRHPSDSRPPVFLFEDAFSMELGRGHQLAFALQLPFRWDDSSG